MSAWVETMLFLIGFGLAGFFGLTTLLMYERGHHYYLLKPCAHGMRFVWCNR